MRRSRAGDPGIETSFAHRSATAVAVAPMRLLSRTDWQGTEHLPAGGCIVAVNHISTADPFAVAHLLTDCGHPPFFLAKDALFDLPVLGRWLAAAGQIPVHRGTGRASLAYADAEAAVHAGRTVVMMPEGTITRDPQGWPMRAKTGAARLALATDAPLIPVGQWGAQQLVPPGSCRPRPWPRPTMRMRVGPAVDLADLPRDDPDRDTLTTASERVMTAITELVAAARGETPPPGRWDPALGSRIPPTPQERP